MVKYKYDAWGVPTIIFDISECKIATINSFRYRGYYYDQEIELYYLQSRYYDAIIGRFINSDDATFSVFYSSSISDNLYSSCENDNINRIDNLGYLSFKIKISAISGIAYGLYKISSCYGMKLNSWKMWAYVGMIFVKGFITGFCTVYSLFSISKKLLKSVAFGILNIICELTLGGIKNAKQLLVAFIDGYGGSLSPSIIKSEKMSFAKDIVIYLCNLLAIKVV